jgi:hypothetical protein
MSHVVLLGDSIFDNARYVPGRPAVIEQVRQALPRPWQATLLAIGRVGILRKGKRSPLKAKFGMALPEFNDFGDLPAGIYPASLEEMFARFGGGTKQRAIVADRLRRIYELAMVTRRLDRLVVFGSFVSDVAEPNDVDVILVMENGFRTEDCPAESVILFDHARADAELGASIFWVRPDMLLGEPLEQFLAFWQTKRDGRQRGIVELKP